MAGLAPGSTKTATAFAAQPRTEPSDTYLVIITTIKNTISATTAPLQSIINDNASEVRIPFPPLKPKNTGKLCPITAAKPDK